MARPSFYRYLPFWVANLIYRLSISGIAGFALFVALTDWLPKLVRYAFNLRILHNYLGSVRVATEIPKSATPEDRARHLERVEALRRKAASLSMPLFLDVSKAELVNRLKLLEDKLRQEQDGTAAGTPTVSPSAADSPQAPPPFRSRAEADRPGADAPHLAVTNACRNLQSCFSTGSRRMNPACMRCPVVDIGSTS